MGHVIWVSNNIGKIVLRVVLHHSDNPQIKPPSLLDGDCRRKPLDLYLQSHGSHNILSPSETNLTFNLDTVCSVAQLVIHGFIYL